MAETNQLKTRIKKVYGRPFEIIGEKGTEYAIGYNNHIIGFAFTLKEADEVIQQFIANNGVGNIEWIPTPFQLGYDAGWKGKKRIPAQDQKFVQHYLAGIEVGEGNKPLKEWEKGWDKANLTYNN